MVPVGAPSHCVWTERSYQDWEVCRGCSCTSVCKCCSLSVVPWAVSILALGTFVGSFLCGTVQNRAQCTWEGHSLDICCLPFPLCCKQRSHAVLTNQLGFCQDIGKCCSVSQAAGWSDCFEGHTGHSLSQVLHGEGLLQE